MLGDIVREIVDAQPDMQVVGRLVDARELVRTAIATDADFVVLGLEDGRLPGSCDQLLELDPAIRVLAVDGDGRRSFVYQLEPRMRPLGELSPDALVAAIRAAMRPRSRLRHTPARIGTAAEDGTT